MELNDEMQGVVDRIEKLLRLAAKNPNQAEAASAAAKAQQLLEAYNLDLATVEEKAGGKSKRTDEKMKGGLYHYQRGLYRAVAELNFCLYFCLQEWDSEKKRPLFIAGSKYWGEKRRRSGSTKGGYVFRHRLVGKTVNVRSTQVMAEYLEQTIERLTRERLNGEGSQFFTKWAISFREGIAATVIEKLRARRRVVLTEARERARAAAEARARAGTAGASSGTAIDIAVLVDAETDANYDFLYGEGWSAEQVRKRAERARARAEAEKEYVEWAKANPEEAKKAEEKARKERRRSHSSRSRTEREPDWGAYSAGQDAGKNVGIDPQTDTRKSAGALG